MGDISKEPSMEEILSSIKRIIAEDADTSDSQGSPKMRARRESERESHRKSVVASMAGEVSDAATSYVDEVLELTDEMPKMGKGGEAELAAAPASTDGSGDEMAPAGDKPGATRSSAPRDTIVSVESEVAARSSLAALSSMIVKSSEPGENTLEGLIREMLRPMLKEWLDANLPTLVEGMVAKEIARITGRPL